MNKQSKKEPGVFAKLMWGKGYYVVLAVCALAVCAAAYAAVAGVGRATDNVVPQNLGEFGNPDTSLDDIERIVSLPKANVQADPAPEAPAPADGADSAEEPPEEPQSEDAASQGAIVTEPKELRAPLGGTIGTSYSNGEMIYSPTMNDYREHTGTDIMAESGAEVRAAASGIIDGLYYDDLWGQVVVLTHAGGMRTVYKNLDSNLPSNITPGARVEGGAVIGKLGDQGLVESAEPPHLHLEVEKNGVLVNPEEYIKFSVVE